MAITTAERKEALAAAVEFGLDELAARGVHVEGNAFSPILLIKGDLNAEERMGGALLAGADGKALRAALLAIGWEPQDLCVLSSVRGKRAAVPEAASSGAPGESGTAASLSTETFREAVETLDPEAIVLLDDEAAGLMRETYADALALIEDFDTAMLKPGLVASVLGRRVLALDGFEAALGDPSQKQRMWAYLKRLPPLGAPY